MRISVVAAVPRGLAEPRESRAAFDSELLPTEGDELIYERGKDASELVPQLWTRGLLKAKGDVVALTLSSMVPRPGWRRAIVEAMTEGVGGVGGAIEPEQAMRPLDWAIHLCRYSGYLLPFAERDAETLPGDNAAYRREAIAPLSETWAGGFWETEVDAGLRERGWRLRMTPRAVVTQGASAGFLSFCRNRWRHGIASGRHRGRTLSAFGRITRALVFPAAAAVMLRRIGRLAKERGRAEGFRRALPRLAVFLTVWAAGEAASYLHGR